jgi:lysophospholipase L1-like esterase
MSWADARKPLLAALALQLGLALVLARVVGASRQSLERDGHWVSTKATLERGVIGAQEFLRGRQATAGQRLNLGAWHGYQEVVYREPIDPVEIACSIVLHGKAHASVVFDRTPAGFAGMRLSADPDRPSMLFRASPQGEFLERAPLGLPPLAAHQPHEVKVEFGEGTVSLTLDGRRLGPWPAAVTVPHQVGFRGGGRMAVVDDVVIRTRGADPLAPTASVYASFDADGDRRLLPGLLILVLLANAVPLGVGWQRGPEAFRHGLLGSIVANATLTVLAAGLLAFLSLRAGHYPAADQSLRAGEQAWTRSTADDIRADIRRRYPAPPAAGTTRLLFLGSSQTWGAGASLESEVMTVVLERMLNGSAEPGRRYECVNGGISAAVSGLLLELYEKEWTALAPRLVVVNLSNNDHDLPKFEANLRRIAQISRAASRHTLFVLEANSGEERPAALAELATHHAAMRSAAEKEGVPLLDMHAALLEQGDRGFLFWDVVHMTSFGQRLMAERLLPEVRRLLATDPQEAKMAHP